MRKILTTGVFMVLWFTMLPPRTIYAESDSDLQARVALALTNATRQHQAQTTTSARNTASSPLVTSATLPRSTPTSGPTSICYCLEGASCSCEGPDCQCVRVSAAQLAQLQKTIKTNSTTKATCSCGPNCTCTKGECGDLNCPTIDPFANPTPMDTNASVSTATKPGPLEWAIYMRQYNAALSANKPLLIWVGETCPSCEQQWSQFIHARLSEYDYPSGQIEHGPAVIIGKPDGMGGMSRVATLPKIPSLPEIQASLGPQPSTGTTSAASGLALGTQQIGSAMTQSTFIPQAICCAPMPMTGFGGFGGMPMGGGFGGFGGGFCGGGGCGGGG